MTTGASPANSEGQEQAEQATSGRARLLQLTALGAFAIGAPLLDLLGRSGEFFAAQGLLGPAILVFAIALLLAPGLLLWLLECALQPLLSRLSRRALPALHLILVGALSSLIALTLLVRSMPDSTAIVAATALLVGAGAAWAVSRSQLLRTFLAVLALSPIGFMGVFAMQPGIRALMASPGALWQSQAARTSVRGPVVVVVFDELPIHSLLDEREEIDAARFPAFAALAAGSTWVRRTSAVGDETKHALPAILTGRYPSKASALPIFAHHPRSLFSLLAATHELNVVETRSMLYPGSAGPLQPESARGSCLLGDLALIYAHLISPEALRSSYPPIDQDWSCLLQPSAPEGEPDVGEARSGWMAKKQHDDRNASQDGAIFRSFIASIGRVHQAAAEDRGSLHFLHVTLPHIPWSVTPKGQVYARSRLYGNAGARWPDEPWWAREAQQRHLLQLQFCDLLLAELVDRLRKLGLYDSALLVVTSDHGVGFWPGDPRRSIEGSRHPEDVLGVPLFIKRPDQRSPERIDRPAETIDVLPSIAEALEIPMPWSTDGCSVFSSVCPERARLVARVADGKGHLRKLQFDPAILARRDALERKLAAFGAASEPLGFYRFGSFAALTGRPITDLPVREGSGGAVALGGRKRKKAQRRRAVVDVRVTAELKLREETDAPVHVAVALNGVVEAVVPAPRDHKGRRRVLAMLPDDHLKSRNDELGFFVVEGSPDSPILAPLRIE